MNKGHYIESNGRLYVSSLMTTPHYQICNDLPGFVNDGCIYMYADDTTVFTFGLNVDQVISTLNSWMWTEFFSFVSVKDIANEHFEKRNQ